MSNRKKITETERDEARAKLRKMLKPGATVYTVLQHVSSSGMTRGISLLIPVTEMASVYVYDPKTNRSEYKRQKATRIADISWLAAKAMGSTMHAKGGISVGGCGMDMGFSLVYSLGSYLWPKGTPKAHSSRNGEPDKSGGYALKHSWL